MKKHMQKIAVNTSRNQSQVVWRRFKKSKLAVAGAIILVVLMLIAIFADFIVDYEAALKQDYKNRLQAPSREHPFGTDSFGRDIFARIIHGSRLSLSIGVLVIAGSLLIGSILGMISGYYGGAIDTGLMRVIDILMAVPPILLVIAIVASLGTGFSKMVIALTIANIPYYARFVRALVMQIREKEFIEAAKAVGTPDYKIMLRHITPNTMAPLIVQVTMGVADGIKSAAALSFLGLGVQPPTPEWGIMLSEGKAFLRYSSYLAVFPGIFVVLTVLALNLLGDGLMDALDPRLKD
jgi:peptide/nickel transport system permease protein